MDRRRWLLVASSWLLVLLAGCQGIPGATSSPPSGAADQCTSQDIRQVVERFIDAFNRGDIAQLDQLVAVGQFDVYSTDAPGQRLDEQAHLRDTLMAYFAARHQQHEQLVLISLDVTYVNSRDAGFWFRVTRSADDGLPPTRYGGKGGVQCAIVPVSLIVWAMDPNPWSPIELLPATAALILLAAAIGTVLLWRRRTGPRAKSRGPVTGK